MSNEKPPITFSSDKKVNLQDIEGYIEKVTYFTAFEGVRGAGQERRLPQGHRLDNHIFCMVIFKNGFHVTGESVCIDRAIFNEATGREIAYKNAIDKAWAAFGFLFYVTAYKD